MEPIVSSETSAIKSQTPGNYPKRNKLQELLRVLRDCSIKFEAHASVHRNTMLIKPQPDATVRRYLFTAKLLYMFRVSQH